MTEFDEEKEEKLRDIAIRVGAAMGEDPEAVFEQFMFWVRSDSMYKAIKFSMALEGIPEGVSMNFRMLFEYKGRFYLGAWLCDWWGNRRWWDLYIERIGNRWWEIGVGQLTVVITGKEWL